MSKTARTLAAFGLALSLPLALVAPQEADAKFVFPYNHPDLEWRTIETEHFYVHYPVSKRPEKTKHPVNAEFMAKRSAKVAEEMWEPMCREFDYYLTEKVHIVLLDQSDDLEGFTIPAWDWIQISGNPGGYFYRMRGRMEWFSDVLVHEFAHVVSLKRNAALGEGAMSIMIGGLARDGIRNHESGGEIAIQGATEPFWWSEGGAEYWSDNTGYNWWTSSRDANLRMTVLDDRLLTYEEWVTRVDKRDWGDGERGYQQGYSIGLYMRERFGEQIYAELSKNSGKKWRPVWEDLIEEITGVPARQIYADWKAFLEAKYAKVEADVTAEGLVEGREMETSAGDWTSTDPDKIDEFYGQDTQSDRKARMLYERQRHMTGTWDFYPRTSGDGAYIGEVSVMGVAITKFPEDALPGVAGTDATDADLMREAGERTVFLPNDGASFGHSFDFVPGRNAVVMTGTEDMLKGWSHTLRIEDGYNWNELYVVDLDQTRADKRKHHGAKEEFQTLSPKYTLGVRGDEARFTAIPNTERGMDPTVSPDGKRVAYLDYADGTVNLVVIDIDGNNKKALTQYNDGSWLQSPDWSPDGKQIVFSMIRNFRQDLYVIDVETGDLKPLNRDDWEDQDPHWAADGSIWFSSDPTGIFNIFRYDPKTGDVTQVTNVLGAAECPWLTPQGNLMYTGFTGFGWKNFIVAGDELFGKDVTDLFDFTPDPAEYKADLAYSEDIEGWFEARKDKTGGENPITSERKYPTFGKWMSPAAFPMFRVENDSMTNWGLSAGGQLYAQDFAEKQTIFGMAMIGEDPLLIGSWSLQTLPFDLSIMAIHYEAKFDYGFLIDDDNDTNTTDDQSVWEGKQNQFVNRGQMFISRPLNDYLMLGAYGSVFEYGFRGTDDTDFASYMRGYDSGLSLSYDALGPRSGAAVTLNYGHAGTDIVYAPYNGRDTDDGMTLDKYQFDRFDARWTQSTLIPTFGSKALQKAKDAGHALTFDAQFGYINRNVSIQDEFRGGGTHPYYMGSGNLQPNNQFSGFPGYSLAGETMGVLYLGYKAPVMRHIDRRWGPLYLYRMDAQIGGTTGNFWSFRAPEEAGSYYTDSFGQRVAYNPDDVRREIPLVDKAYKNGNYLLYDLNAELRVSSNLFGENGWDSFVRFAWGFNDVKGVGDVNGDDIQDTTDSGIGDALSNEFEKAGPRIYVGFGTGW